MQKVYARLDHDRISAEYGTGKTGTGDEIRGVHLMRLQEH